MCTIFDDDAPKTRFKRNYYDVSACTVCRQREEQIIIKSHDQRTNGVLTTTLSSEVGKRQIRALCDLGTMTYLLDVQIILMYIVSSIDFLRTSMTHIYFFYSLEICRESNYRWESIQLNRYHLPIHILIYYCGLYLLAAVMM